VKRMHPAEKLVRALDLWGYKTYEQKQAIIARHVKPLLDALAWAHPPHSGESKCDVCLLYAAWRIHL
jgi:hypothetical protein